MKKELAYIKDRYKKHQNNKIVSNNGYVKYEKNECSKIEKLFDYKYSNDIRIERLSEKLFSEFGSFIKVKNIIEDIIGYEKFKEIYIYCINNYISYDVFIEYIKNPDKFDSNKIPKRNYFCKKLLNNLSKFLMC